MRRTPLQRRMDNRDKWYDDAAEYWEKVEPTVNGMLQGYEAVTDIDTQGSSKFIEELKEEKILTSDCHRAADFGAGIGRVSKYCLLKHFQVVDIIEQCKNFTENVHKYMDDEALSSRVENIYTIGAQEFVPKESHYDVIWMQWFVGHFTDDDFVDVLKRCRAGLKEGGCIVIKDNVATRNNVLDEDDSSVTRLDITFKAIFEKAGMTLRKVKAQDGLPSTLFTVNMYALT